MLQSLSPPHIKETAAPRPYSPEKKLAGDIRYAAFNALARREHSQQELRQKLIQKFDKSAPDVCALIEQVLEAIAAEGLQSDERYLAMLVRGRTNQGYGPIRISQELKQKGISSAEFEDFLDLRSETWKVRAREAKEKKFGSVAPSDQKGKAKQMRFLQYRGFNTEQIRYALSSVFE